MYDIKELDKLITFLSGEATTVGAMRAMWATNKARQFTKAAEILRQVRQNQQMTGMGGKRITE